MDLSTPSASCCMQGTQQPLLDKSESSRECNKARIIEVSNTCLITVWQKLLYIIITTAHLEIIWHFSVFIIFLLNTYLIWNQSVDSDWHLIGNVKIPDAWHLISTDNQLVIWLEKNRIIARGSVKSIPWSMYLISLLWWYTGELIRPKGSMERLSRCLAFLLSSHNYNVNDWVLKETTGTHTKLCLCCTVHKGIATDT